ncbi:MAG: DEAD/DEAH box helicase, partial [Cyanobium sp.]
MTADARLGPIEAWFAGRGWRPMDFQRRCWQAYLAGESGLLQVPTGSGKTYAAVMGPIAEALAEALAETHGDAAGGESNRAGNGPGSDAGSGLASAACRAPATATTTSSSAPAAASTTTTGATVAGSVQAVQKPGRRRNTATSAGQGLRLLVITPLRALSRDLALAIEEPITAMGWPLRV